jgi:hypothetical protein
MINLYSSPNIRALKSWRVRDGRDYSRLPGDYGCIKHLILKIGTKGAIIEMGA